MTPKGPFDLTRSREFFGGWPSPTDNADALVMAFPVEGSSVPSETTAASSR
jgi:hypothetical protein